jgi:trk system potassium uptake protein TrkH
MRLVYPSLVQPASLGEGGMGSAMRGVWVGAAAFFILFAVVLLAVSAGMPSFEAALAAAAALVSNTGPVYDAAGKGWPVMASLPTGSVIAAGIAMVAGRLEIIGLAVVVHLLFWRT